MTEIIRGNDANALVGRKTELVDGLLHCRAETFGIWNFKMASVYCYFPLDVLAFPFDEED